MWAKNTCNLKISQKKMAEDISNSIQILFYFTHNFIYILKKNYTQQQEEKKKKKQQGKYSIYSFHKVTDNKNKNKFVLEF